MRTILFMILSLAASWGASVTNPPASMGNYPPAAFTSSNAVLGVTQVGSNFQTRLFSFGVAITNTGLHSVVAGGGTNRIESPWSVIGGGRNNLGYGPADSNAVWVIAGGEDNTIALGNNKHAVISGGQLNLLVNSRYGTISGGWVNKLGSESHLIASNAVIGGGYSNTNEGFAAFLGGGYKNRLYDLGANDVSGNVLVGGGNNYAKGFYVFLGGGIGNVITNNQGDTPSYSAIVCGQNNYMAGTVNFIGTGNGNVITNGTGGCFIGNGAATFVNASRGGVVVGNGHQILGDDSFIGGGTLNQVGLGAEHGQIIGGIRNRVDDFATFAGIAGNHVTNTTPSSFEIGQNNSAKTRFDANGFRTLGAMAAAETAVTLTADNQSVSTSARSYIRLQSDNGTAGNRTFVLTQGSYTGQLLAIEWVGTNAGELVDDSAQSVAGNHRLLATWTPTQYDTLSLIFNGTDWIERGRSAN
jgi:hypothetical protein